MLIGKRSQQNKLRTLEAISSLCLLANDIKNGVDQLRALGVVCVCSKRDSTRDGGKLTSFGPVVTSPTLSEDEVVRAEETT